jgi:hypothetical protein
MELAMEMRSGWLVARVVRAGFAADLAPAERLVLETALAGLCKLAGVELLHEQLRAVLPPGAAWDVTAEGLVVDFQGGTGGRVSYSLRPEGPIAPRVRAGQRWRTLPVLDPSQVLYTEVPIDWKDWVEFWQRAHNIHGPPPTPIVSVRVLSNDPR